MAKDDFVGVSETKGDLVAVCQCMAGDLATVNEDAHAMSTVFELAVIRLKYNRRRLTGNSRIRKLKVIAGFFAPTDQKWGLRYRDGISRSIRRDDIKNSAVS